MSSQVHQHIYLLLQAVLGLFLVLTGLSQSDQTTFMFCISLTIITFDIVIKNIHYRILFTEDEKQKEKNSSLP